MSYFVFHVVATRCHPAGEAILVENATQAGIMQAETADQVEAACMAATLARNPPCDGWKGHKAQAMPAILDNAPTVREYLEAIIR